VQSTLARFEPLGDRPVEASERHYTRVHIPLAIELLGSVPAIVQYSTYSVVRQYDATGGWDKRPTAWRFASQLIRTQEEVGEGEAATAFPEEVRTRLAQDHRNCLRGLRRFDVENVVLQGSFTPTLSTQRYFFEFEATAESDPIAARAAFVSTCDQLAGLASGAPGLRGVVRRGVEYEAEAGTLDDAGQFLTGRRLPRTTMVGYLEVVFDSAYAAEPFFRRSTVRDALRTPGFASIEGYEVREVVGFDTRP
jgi:hypothetical protein